MATTKAKKPTKKLTQAELMALCNSDDYMYGDPHLVRDGPWGGWGPASWFRGESFGFNPTDVVERAKSTGGWRWTRIWVAANKNWRALSEQERQGMPDANNPFDAH